MDEECLPKCLLFGELIEGKRSTGGQKKCFKEKLKNSFKDFSIDPDVLGEPGFRQSLLAKCNALWYNIL